MKAAPRLARRMAAAAALIAGCGSDATMTTDSAGSDAPATTRASDATSTASDTTSTVPTSTDPISTGPTSTSTGEPPSGSGTGGGDPPTCRSDSLGRPLGLHRGAESYKIAPAKRHDLRQGSAITVFIGDVTGDERADIVGFESYQAHLLAQRDDGTIADALVIDYEKSSSNAATLVHASPDALLDIVVLDDGGLEVLPALGNGSFGPSEFFPALHGKWLRASDLNADGYGDLLWLQDDNVLAFAHGDGTGDFPVPLALPAAPQQLYGRMALGDFTGDANPDIVIQDSFTGMNLIVIPHDGVAGPSPDGWTTIPLTEPCSGFDVGDVDGDGLADIVWQEAHDGTYDSRTHLLLAGPDGFASPLEIAQHDYGGGHLRIADANADGRNDVVVLHASGFDLSLILSTPQGMGPQTVIPFPTAASVESWAIAVGDVDCDGCPDVVAADSGAIDVFRGYACGG